MVSMTFRVCACTPVVCAMLAGCAPSSTSPASLGLKVNFSCTEKGVARNLSIAKEISDVVEPGLVTSTSDSHGCDSGTSGYYDFDKAARPTIIDRFDCRDDHVGDFHNGMRCRAKSGEFALYTVKDDNVVSTEALP